MEGSSLQVEVMQKVPELVVHARMSKGEQVKCTKEKKEVKGWSTEEIKDKANSRFEIDAEEMFPGEVCVRKRWINAGRIWREKLRLKFQTSTSSRGSPLEWELARRSKKYRIRKWCADCWARIFALFREYNLERLQSMHEDSLNNQK